jgi:hypothetical protein
LKQTLFIVFEKWTFQNKLSLGKISLVEKGELNYKNSYKIIYTFNKVSDINSKHAYKVRSE